MNFIMVIQLFIALSSMSYYSDGVPITRGSIYALIANHRTLIGTLMVEENYDKNNIREVVFSFNSPDGELLVRENYYFSGKKIVGYAFDQRQIADHGEMYVKDSELVFDYQGRTAHERMPENLFVGANSVDFIQDHWNKLLSGSSVEGRVPLVDLRQTIRIKFLRDSRFEDASSIVIKAVPAFWLFRWLSDPIYFQFDSGKQILAYRGPIAFKEKINGKFRNQMGEIIYEADR